jgi:UDP-N-acetylmuramoyl-tripeptide--D-alanyl-D-alanine ligase
MSEAALWTVDAMRAAMHAEVSGALPRDITGISIDSRTIAPGEAYFAIRGDVHDGHDFVAAALTSGAALAVVSAERRGQFGGDARLLVVADVLAALVDLARVARARTEAKIIAVTGSVGKTSTKEALRLVLSAQGRTHASVASFNNHWGVPLSLSRCPADARFAIFEIGMNHAGEIVPLTRLVRPHMAIVTTVEPVHLEFFASVEAIADAKAEIFAGLEAGGAAILNRDNAQFDRLRLRATEAHVGRIVGFGVHADAEARLIDMALHAECSTVKARILGQDIAYKIGAPGRHMVMNSLAVLAAASLAGADLALAALALARMEPPEGRGARRLFDLGSGTALLIDESYNANPASMRAAFDVLAQAPTGKRGRRIAVLGDMLELGAASADLHRGLAEAIDERRIDLVYCCGPQMRNLWDALPASRRGGYAADAAALEAPVAAAFKAGDAMMVKGSAGSRMKIIVNAIERRYQRETTGDDVTV